LIDTEKDEDGIFTVVEEKVNEDGKKVKV